MQRCTADSRPPSRPSPSPNSGVFPSSSSVIPWMAMRREHGIRLILVSSRGAWLAHFLKLYLERVYAIEKGATRQLASCSFATPAGRTCLSHSLAIFITAIFTNTVTARYARGHDNHKWMLILLGPLNLSVRDGRTARQTAGAKVRSINPTQWPTFPHSSPLSPSHSFILPLRLQKSGGIVIPYRSQEFQHEEILNEGGTHIGMDSSVEEPRLPSYTEALEWGVAPPPRPQWAPPRPPSPSIPRRIRPVTARPFSMSSIDEAIANSRFRPQTSTDLRQRPPSLLDIGLDAVLSDSLNNNNSGVAPSRASSTRSSNRSSVTVPARPSTSQGFQSGHSTPTRGNSSSRGVHRRPPTPLPEEPASPAYSLVPDAVPQHIRPILPPGYARHDPIARTYLLRSPLIYSTTGSSPQNAAYQLDARDSTTGRPFQLAIRPLDHLESRTLSLRSDRRRSLGYDDDHTLYLLQVMQLLGGFGVPGLGFGPSWRIEMQRDPKGDSAHNKGFIRFEGGGILGTGRGFMQRSACKFFYMTKKTEQAWNSAHEWRLMNKYGWQPEFEWNKRLMFSVEKKRHAMGKGRGYEWKDGKGRLLAVESAEGRLDLTGTATSMSAQSREALLACWVGKAWAAGALIW